MKSVRPILASLLVLAALPLAAWGQEPIKCARTPALSPDGKLVAFSYLGDIWVVEAIGGVARPVTMHEAYDVGPVFSPDGKSIAFTSNRFGSYDVFVVPVQGGKPKRLTFDSAADIVNDWSPDGKQVLFASFRSTAYPSAYDLYTVPVEGGRVKRLSAFEGREGVWSPRGDQIAYVRGPGTWYRRGYRGSSSDDIWLCNADGSNNRQITTFAGQDNSPMWGPDGKLLYYVTESSGTANVVRLDLASEGKETPITKHKDEGVRRARISGNGEWIAYECGADIWITSTRDGQSRKIYIEVHADDKANADRKLTYSGRGMTEYSLSPDEKHVVFVVHGELFLMPIAGGKATQLTDHPAYDHGAAWASDGKSLLFLSDRGGQEDIYRLEPDDPEHPEMTKAHRFKVTQVTNTPEPESALGYSPDGKLVAFLRDSKLWIMKADGSDAKVLAGEPQVYDYDWSPDSKWIAFSRTDGTFASDLYVMPVDGKEPPRNVTRYATWNADVSWSQTGHKLGFISQRREGMNMCVLSLQKPAITGAPASNDIDWEDIHLRVAQPAAIPAQEGAVSPDGTKIAFRSTGSSGDDLWIANVNGSQLTRVTTGNQRPTQIVWSKRLSSVIYFRDSTGSLRLASVGFGGGTEPARVPFTAKLTIRQDEEFAEIFEQSWRALSEHFYDKNFHGVNWRSVYEKYRPLVKHMGSKEDLYALISLMIGELNASHLGISGFGRTPDEVTADLGILFDEAYAGPGLKVTEILKRGPSDRRGLGLKANDLVVAIDNVPISENSNLSLLLNDKVGESVIIHYVTDGADPKDPKNRKRIEITAADRSATSKLMYERWVEKNTQRVSEASKGQLGYIHIPSMDDAGLDAFVRALYSDNYDKEAIVLDVRYNSGGFTHDQVLNYLGAKEHTIFRQRHGGVGPVLRSYDRKWTKPLVLLINNRSYSDAEIFPSAFRTLGLGKLVGQPTGGLVIGTSSIRLIDGSTFRIPRTGVYTVKGVNMEKEGVSPDFLVVPHPDDLAKGKDVQLDKAVEVLQADLAIWKKTHVARQPEEIRPAPNVVVPAP